MADRSSVKKYKPVTPSRRHMSVVRYKGVITATEPHKKLTKGGSQGVGRAGGRISTRHKGGGHKKLHRAIDFTYAKRDIPAKIETIEYDPYRSGFIALVCYADGARAYILAPSHLAVGDEIIASEKAKVKVGNRLPLKNIPVGTFIYNVEIQPGAGARLARSAGNFIEVIGQDAGYTFLKMPSTEVRKVLSEAWASVGEVSNPEYRLQNLGKAGRSRWLGIRPTVRGSAMNPVDHPHGGGEGKGGRGHRRARSLWGKPTGKGQKSRTPKKYSNKLIVSRRKVGKKR
jgi:large subunit ribosomal protein L2